MEYDQLQREKAARKAEAIAIETQKYFEKCSSIAELKDHLGEIKRIDGVTDIYTEGSALYVEIKGWGTVGYLFPEAFNTELDDTLKQELIGFSTKALYGGSSIGDNHYSICIANQAFKNEAEYFVTSSNTAFALCSSFQICGIDYRIQPLTLEWLLNDMYNYDSVIMMTHGAISKGCHWLLTTEELDREYFVKDYSEIVKKHDADGNSDIMPMCVKETNNGEDYIVWYVAASENLINKLSRKFSNNEVPHIVFNISCYSLNSGQALADAFFSKGANYYLGFDGKNSVGPQSMAAFFAKLLDGKSVGEAFSTMGYKNDGSGALLHCINDGHSDAWSSFILPPCIPNEVLNTLGHYMQINRGYYPPILEGEYYVYPLIYQYGTWPYYYPGLELSPVFISFSGQDNDNMTVNVAITNSNGLDKTSGIGHLGGFGNQFSVYVNGYGHGTGYAYNENYELFSFSQTYTTDMVVSGTVNGTSIEGLQYGFTITGKSAEPTPYAIVHVADVGTTMVFRDGDGISGYYPFPGAAYSSSLNKANH